MNYRHTGKYIDWDGAKNSSQKSTDLINMSITKNLFGNVFSLRITNLLNERYQKPATYSQNGRELKFGFKKFY